MSSPPITSQPHVSPSPLASQQRQTTLHRSQQMKRRCCCGDKDDWNYPWDKNLPKCCLLTLMWYLFCIVVPCSFCVTRYRNVYCCVEEGNFEDTCVGDCICGIPRGSSVRRRGQVRHSSESSID